MEDDVDMEDGVEEKDTYAWEKEYQRTWEMLGDASAEEDFMMEKRQEFERKLQKRLRLQEQLSRPVRKGLRRHMFLVMDGSQSVLLEDVKPNRLGLMRSASKRFVEEFFDQNPISQLGVIVTTNGVAHKLSDLTPNAEKNCKAIDAPTVAGQPSLQNALEVARTTLNLVPRHGSREVLVLWASLSSKDPGDVLQTIESVARDRIRVSVVGLGAEVHVLRRLVTETGGKYHVALDEDHYSEIMGLHVPPPPANKFRVEAALVPMGFPEHKSGERRRLCVCHKQVTTRGYFCPRCNAKCCELPTECLTCGLTLISSPHLARSYHHLFSVPNFKRLELTGSSAAGDEGDQARAAAPPTFCSGCLEPLDPSNTIPFQCPSCQNIFCLDCDAFIHETLHNCPHCELD